MSYAKLEEHYRKLSHLGHVSAILGWDEAVMMAQASGHSRAEAVATLQQTTHELATDERVGEWIAAAQLQQEREALDPWQAANLREIEHHYRRATCLAPELVAALARACTRTEQAWRQQRANNDWRGFQPLLDEVVRLRRETAQALGDALELEPYDALLDEYEPGLRSSEIDRLFGEIKAWLPGLTQEILEAQRSREITPPPGPFAIQVQRDLALRLMKKVGFDDRRGRLDVSHHPFCGGVPDDVRITTRYDDEDFAKALMGVLHETGHAKYEQGLPERWSDQPVGRSRGMALHESQSLLQEMQISRSRSFLKLAAPMLREAFPESAQERPRAFEVDELHRLYTRVERGFIRVDADEVTYPCHILLRYDIERDLIAGRIETSDIPERWNLGMLELLELDTRGNHRDGCMQDVHWASGALAYFPTYTLGALIAAQLYSALAEALPDRDQFVERGEFEPINRWLSQEIWSHGSLYESWELVKRATGEEVGTRTFEQHLRRRYL